MEGSIPPRLLTALRMYVGRNEGILMALKVSSLRLSFGLLGLTSFSLSVPLTISWPVFPRLKAFRDFSLLPYLSSLALHLQVSCLFYGPSCSPPLPLFPLLDWSQLFSFL